MTLTFGLSAVVLDMFSHSDVVYECDRWTDRERETNRIARLYHANITL